MFVSFSCTFFIYQLETCRKITTVSLCSAQVLIELGNGLQHFGKNLRFSITGSPAGLSRVNGVRRSSAEI